MLTQTIHSSGNPDLALMFQQNEVSINGARSTPDLPSMASRRAHALTAPMDLSSARALLPETDAERVENHEQVEKHPRVLHIKKIA